MPLRKLFDGSWRRRHRISLDLESHRRLTPHIRSRTPDGQFRVQAVSLKMPDGLVGESVR
jgi:hypothetical protein